MCCICAHKKDWEQTYNWFGLADTYSQVWVFATKAHLIDKKMRFFLEDKTLLNTHASAYICNKHYTYLLPINHGIHALRVNLMKLALPLRFCKLCGFSSKNISLDITAKYNWCYTQYVLFLSLRVFLCLWDV